MALAACATTQEKDVATAAESTESEMVQEPELNIDSLVSVIDAMRAEIESAIKEPLSVETTNLREKIKQKWSKIHFYTVNGELARIKTYPHEGISKRTEEFYVSGGELVLVTIEDDGSGEKGKSKDALDKMYYFHQGEMIAEAESVEEVEYSIRESDAEELLSEFNEYMNIYSERK